MIENRVKDFHPRTYPDSERPLLQLIKAITTNRNAVNQVLEYFASGKLPVPIESFQYRIPDYHEPWVIGWGDKKFFAAEITKRRNPFYPVIQEAYVVFSDVEAFPNGLPQVRFLRSGEKSRVPFYFNWRFSTYLSLEANLTEFSADINAPSVSTRGPDGLLEVQRGPMPGMYQSPGEHTH